ncbi:RNA polymerase sigma factor [Sorangium sp. So ce362]|uniref:RNA polymerase sigma factor n=1 Tax=Sorangium sp. So ce362 TaxID=3133303 RepID=UPI003F5FCCF9
MDKPATGSPGFELFRRLARRHGVPERNAEDVAQEALLRWLEADRRIEPGGDPAPYRVTIAINQARNHVRDARRSGEVLTSFDEREVCDECPTPEELLRRRQREALTRQLIDQVSPKYRALLIRHELEETPLAEIAAELGLPLATVKTQHRRAREELEVHRRRWAARQRSHGWDESACVPLAFGFHGGGSWTAWLRRVDLRILVQGALVLLTGALVPAVPPSLRLNSWQQPAVARSPGTAPAAQATTAPTAGNGAHRAAGLAAPTTPPSPSPTEQRSVHAEAVVSSTPAPSMTTVPRAESPASAARSAVSERERSLVNQARRAMEAHSAIGDVEARRLLETHAQQFPRGRLAAEREALLRQLR